MQNVRFRLEDKLGITELSHFRKIETRDFRFHRDSLPDEEFEREVDEEAEREDETDQRGDAHELRGKLAGVTVEQPGNRAGDSVPAPP